MPPINTMMPQPPAAQTGAPVHTPRYTSVMDSLARILLIALFAILPFFFFPVSWLTALQSKVLVSATILGAVAILWTIARIREGSGSLPWNMLFAASAFVPIAYAISTVINGFTTVSLLGTGVEPDTLAVICLEFAGLALTAMVLGGVERNTTSALRALLLGVLVLQLIHVIHVIFPSLTLGGVLAGETGNAMGTWHEFTMLIGFALVSSLALVRSSVSDGIWRYLVIAVGVLAVPILIINNFADVWIAVAISAIVVMLIRWYQSRSAVSISFIRTEWVVALVFAASALLAFFGPKVVALLPERISVIQIEVRPSWQGTFQVGEQSLSNPKALIFGVGPNTFTREWGLHKPIEVNQTPFWNSDFNVGVAPIPTSFISLGIIGVLSWLFFIVAVLWSAIGLWIRRGETMLSSRVLTISVGVVYMIAFHLSSVPGTSLGLLMFLMTGLLIAVNMQSFAQERSFTVRGGNAKNAATIAVAAVIVLTTLVSAIAVVRAVLADAMINRAIVSYNSTQDLQQSTDLIGRALGIQPSNDRAHRSAVELGLLKLQQLIAANNPDQDAARAALQTTLEETIKHGLEAVEIDGRDYQNWLQLATLYSQLAGARIEGAYDNARAAYVRAQQENPTSPLPLLNLGQLDALQGNYDAALENLTKAVQLKPDLASAYYLASQIYVAKNDANNALLAAAQAAQFAPNDPLAWYNGGAIAYAAGAYADATVAMQQALAIQPQYANAMYILGLSLYQQAMIAQQQGDTASQQTLLNDTFTVFNALNQLDPNQPIVVQILTNLQAGKPIDTPLPGTQTSADAPTN